MVTNVTAEKDVLSTLQSFRSFMMLKTCLTGSEWYPLKGMAFGNKHFLVYNQFSQFA